MLALFNVVSFMGLAFRTVLLALMGISSIFAHQDERGARSLGFVAVAALLFVLLGVHRTIVRSYLLAICEVPSFFLAGSFSGLVAVAVGGFGCTFLFLRISQLLKAGEHEYIFAVVGIFLIISLCVALGNIIPNALVSLMDEEFPLRRRLIGDVGLAITFGTLVHLAIKSFDEPDEKFDKSKR